MKKFLSIKNTQGIYVARASFSSDETVIDFVNSKSSDNCNIKPVSIIFTPDQIPASSSSIKPSIAIEPSYDSISEPSQALVVAKSPSKKKLKAKVLKFLHLKKKSKMGDNLNEDPTKKSDELPSTSNSYPMLPTPKLSRSKGRTAALVKKFSLTPRKSPPKELSVKKSAIPLRTATSVETISNAPQLALQNRVETTASVSHHSMSEMNLVNIDYRQESTSDNLDVGVKVGQTQYRSYRNVGSTGINQSGSISADSGTSNLTRGWNASSNLSIKSGVSLTNNGNNSGGGGGVNVASSNRIASGRKSTSTEKLQITISGKKRTTNNTVDSATDLQRNKQQQQQQLSDIEPKRIERKPLTMQQPPKKFNINHDLTLMNTVGVPPAPTTQAPSAIPTYRAATTTAPIKNVVQNSTSIKAQSTMQSQQSVDTSASAANVGHIKRAPPKRADTLVTVTSFDVEEPDDIAAASKLPAEGDDTSLLTEIIEAERRNSISMDLPERGRRYPGVAASETIKFAQPSTSSETSGQETKPTQSEIIPKVIIEEVPSSPSETPKKPKKSDEKFEAAEELIEQSVEKSGENDGDIDNELSPASSHSDSAKALQANEDNEAAHPTLQFEVGKQVRPIFPSNQNLHLNTYSALDNDPATAYTSILTTSSYIDTHNNDSFAHVHAEPLSAPPNVSANDKELIIDDHELHQIRSQQQSNRGRRRIAYIESTSKQAGTPSSTSNSTINTEDDYILASENHSDSTLSQFSHLHTRSTFYTDFIMPPYGDLVWDDDGVNERNAIDSFLVKI